MWRSYEVLSDPDSREAYDSFGMSGMGGQGGGPGGAAAMDEFFAQFFSAGGPGGAQFGFDFGPGFPGAGRGRAQDEVVPYDVKLEDLYNGKTVHLNLEKTVPCPTCQGSGAKTGAKPKPCVKCEGHGYTHVHSSVCLGVSSERSHIELLAARTQQGRYFAGKMH